MTYLRPVSNFYRREESVHVYVYKLVQQESPQSKTSPFNKRLAELSKKACLRIELFAKLIYTTLGALRFSGCTHLHTVLY